MIVRIAQFGSQLNRLNGARAQLRLDDTAKPFESRFVDHFQRLAPVQLQHFDSFGTSGRPIVGLNVEARHHIAGIWIEVKVEPWVFNCLPA